ncbi:prostaglandin reductase 1-like [Neocloeon triangulifer]|uniref:prostaglandin reductase 1-like n=1 Tax=Neocloeon triangulifer TaxID=2078957 RepID=UPI00286F2603|nr:prostaglandin reductase 1-like [Neocloeon triangulifer]
MVKARKWIIAKNFEGAPKESNFKLVEEELPAIKNGEILLEALYFSVDPYMRAFDLSGLIGQRMVGSQVAKVLESKHQGYKPGDLVMGYFGWQSHSVHHGDEPCSLGLDSKIKPYVMPDFQGLSPSLGLGVLGMPGNTSYFGFLEICQPKAGETVVVNAAAGAVGMHVGQIAKIKGCKVIGFAGSDDKVDWLKKEIGFDAAYNYKKVDIDAALAEAAPNGVDCYFDNVGGEMSSTVINRMNHFGRISICGAISAYNDTEKPKATIIQGAMNRSELKMEGFMVYRWEDRWLEGIKQNIAWIKEGKLKYQETVTKGFENIPKAFIEMMEGKNFGKAVIKA